MVATGKETEAALSMITVGTAIAVIAIIGTTTATAITTGTATAASRAGVLLRDPQ
jgi:hypothetical protein